MTRSKPLISVVVPSYNDKPIIMPFYEAIRKVLDSTDQFDYEIIYVDDGSSDGSQETLAAIAEQDPRVTYIELFRNFGQQRALFAGMSKSKGDYVVTLDGDYQYDPEAILQLVSAMGGQYDMASGIRVKRTGSFLEKWSSRLGNYIIRRILGIAIQDFGSVKAFSRTLVSKILNLRHSYSDVYPTALSLHPSLVEVLVDHKERYHGRSHWNIWMRFRIYLDLYIAYGNDEFSLPFRFGALVTVSGIGLLFFSFAYKTFLGHEATYAQLGIMSILWTLIGVFFAFWSLVMSFLVRIYKQNAWGEPYLIRRIVAKGGDVSDEGS
ncbi:MAG: glycosyltransferase family 2 protein [Deltaproteobacteria bacterium]